MQLAQNQRVGHHVANTKMARNPKIPKRPLQARIPEDLYERIERVAAVRATDITGATTQGLMMWLDESPVASSYEEIWALKALRAMYRQHPGLAAKAVLNLSVSAEEDASFPLTEDLHGELVRLSTQYDQYLAAKEARRALLSNLQRKTQKTR